MNGGLDAQRTISLLGATSVGVGAIVGGGILALAGVAFATTGPGALLAFALNGIIAVLTALSFAEMSAAFPQSGGTYTFARKVLSVEAAFAVGWVVWFASIVAAVLYALGFASYLLLGVARLWQAAVGEVPVWLQARSTSVVLAAAATAFYSAGLVRGSTSGGQWATIGKVVVFAVLIAGGVWALSGVSLADARGAMTPFLPNGASGLLQAMGYTFITLQGFDLIAAVAGEVKEPQRTLPRAMLLSLAVALVIYLPFLFILATVGVAPGESIATVSAEQPAAVVAIAAGQYLGDAGFWLVVTGAILAMLSALQANLFAASRFALSMARDRTLPQVLGRRYGPRAVPVAAVVASAMGVFLILILLPDVAAAGAAASLIFLVTFSLAHGTSVLARYRGGRPSTFRVPLFPYVPIATGLACVALAAFQAVTVPSAGRITLAWLALGGLLFVSLFARRARVFDASTQALDPMLTQLRGRAPLVLVPIANPTNAAAMVAVATALSPPAVGRVLLLSVVRMPDSWDAAEPPRQLHDTQAVLGAALTASFAAGLAPEALVTVAPQRWNEIHRVARIHRCESLLLGLSKLSERVLRTELEDLISRVDCDVVVLRAPADWKLSDARRILVPVGGRGGHDRLRARLLGSLCRSEEREVTFLRVLREGASDSAVDAARRILSRLAEDEAPRGLRVAVCRGPSPTAEVIRQAAESDLIVLGLQRLGRHRKAFGDVAVEIADNTSCALVLISSSG